MNGEKLRLLRLAMRWQQGELAAELGLPQPNISAMESGVRPIPSSVKERLSFMTGFSHTFFDEPVRVDVPMGSVLRYRRARDKYRKPDEFHPYCQLVFNTFEPLTAELKPRQVRISRLVDVRPEEAAEYLRSVLGVRNSAPLDNLTSLVETAGVRVIGIPEPVIKVRSSRGASEITREPIPPDEDFQGFSFWTNSNLPVIFVRSDLPPDLFQWVVGHEMLHLVKHSSFRGSDKEAEKDGQIGTREFFMPEAVIREAFPSGNLSTSYLVSLASRWNVSLKSLILRGADLGLLSDVQKRYHLAADYRGAGSGIVVKRQLPRFYRQMCEVLFGKPVDPSAIHRKTGASKTFIEDVLLAHGGSSEDLLAS